MTTRNTSTIQRRVAWSIAGLNLTMMLAGLANVIGLLNMDRSVQSVVYVVAKMFSIPIYSLLAVLVVSRHPRHTIGWLFLIVSFFTALSLITYIAELPS
jgi:uncharacterized membrane protein SirB2